ncbi:MAG: hypothetical protein ACRDLY_00985, partial [Thermoleophilaceae bacterium]
MSRALVGVLRHELPSDQQRRAFPMANLVSSRPRVRGTRRGRRAGERFARTVWERGRGRARSMGGPAATTAALLVAGGVGA